MRRSWSRIVAVAPLAVVAGALVLGVGCTPEKKDAIGAPSNVTAALVAFDVIHVEFTPPSGANALELQARIDASGWESIGEGPGDSTYVDLSLTSDAPEAATYGFRLRARKGGATSGWSGEATVFRGVRPATNVMALLVNGLEPPVHLVWARGSTQADALRVERRLVAFDGSVGPWSVVATLPLDATSYDDADAGLAAAFVDGASFDYALVYAKATTDSERAVGRTGQAPPLAPTALTASAVDAASIRLDWTARSRYATKQVVLRAPRLSPWPGEAVAELPDDAATYTDAVPAGTYIYRISARVGDFGNTVNYVADSAPAIGFTALPDVPLGIRTIPLPQGDQVARDSLGRFATVRTVSGLWYGLQTSRETATGWDVHDTVLDGYAALARRGILFGPGDRLHVLWARSPYDPSVHHEWLDGAWSAETFASALLPRDAVVDGAGALHLVTCDPSRVAYATNASGAWTTEQLPASRPGDACALAVGPLGDVRVAYTCPREVQPGESSPTASDLFVLRDAGAGWTEELVPVGPEGTQIYSDVLRIFAPSADATVVVYEHSTRDFGAVALRAIARDAGGWGAPAAVGTRASNGMPDSFDMAASPDGSRVAVAWNGTGASPTTLAIRDGAGSWTSWPLHETGWGMTVGFSPAGKLWVLDGTGGTWDALLYEEP